MKRFLLGAVVATVAVAAACVGDSAVNGAGAAAGTERGACFTNGTCNTGLQCVDMVCVHADGGGAGVDGGAGMDATSSAMDGSTFSFDAGDSGPLLDTDPDNCGAVGHKCPSAKCALGECYKRVFVSSGDYAGDLGSTLGTMAAANKHCQDLADVAVGFGGGKFQAWISVDANQQPAMTFTKSRAPYVRKDAAIVANNWTELTTLALITDLGLDENGVSVSPGKTIWTNTNSDGTIVSTATATNCSSFSMSSSAYTGPIGQVGTAKLSWSFVSGQPEPCGNSHPIYCFEQ